MRLRRARRWRSECKSWPSRTAIGLILPSCHQKVQLFGLVCEFCRLVAVPEIPRPGRRSENVYGKRTFVATTNGGVLAEWQLGRRAARSYSNCLKVAWVTVRHRVIGHDRLPALLVYRARSFTSSLVRVSDRSVARSPRALQRLLSSLLVPYTTPTRGIRLAAEPALTASDDFR